MTDRSSDHRVEMPCAAGVDALRGLLRAHARKGNGPIPDEAWRVAARLMCDDARSRAVRVEELLIALKRAWPGVAGAEGVRRTESPQLLARFVTICVEEYYSRWG